MSLYLTLALNDTVVSLTLNLKLLFKIPHDLCIRSTKNKGVKHHRRIEIIIHHHYSCCLQISLLLLIITIMRFRYKPATDNVTNLM
jgi:hypothetical protein